MSDFKKRIYGVVEDAETDSEYVSYADSLDDLDGENREVAVYVLERIGTLRISRKVVS